MPTETFHDFSPVQTDALVREHQSSPDSCAQEVTHETQGLRINSKLSNPLELLRTCWGESPRVSTLIRRINQTAFQEMRRLCKQSEILSENSVAANNALIQWLEALELPSTTSDQTAEITTHDGKSLPLTPKLEKALRTIIQVRTSRNLLMHMLKDLPPLHYIRYVSIAEAINRYFPSTNGHQESANLDSTIKISTRVSNVFRGQGTQESGNSSYIVDNNPDDTLFVK